MDKNDKKVFMQIYEGDIFLIGTSRYFVKNITVCKNILIYDIDAICVVLANMDTDEEYMYFDYDFMKMIYKQDITYENLLYRGLLR